MASTDEGGSGARTTEVPKRENSCQGGLYLSQPRVQDLSPFAATAGTPGLPDRKRLGIVELIPASPDHVLSHPGGLEDDPRAAATQLTGFVAEPKPPLTFVQVTPDRIVTSGHRLHIDRHSRTVDTSPAIE